jgi:transposase
MIGSTRSLRVFAYPAPCDLRKGFDALHGLVATDLGLDPLSGDCFLFCNRRRTSAKVLHFDGTGLCIYSKRLERGRFACLWAEGPGEPVRMTMTELALFLEGSRLAGRIPLSPPPVRLGRPAWGRKAESARAVA